MLHRQPAIQSLQHHHNRSGVAAALWVGKQLQGVPVELHGVVPGYPSTVLETQDLLQAKVRTRRLECGLGALGRNPKTPVESGQELLQHGLGLLKGGCFCEPEFRDQPVLEGSSRTLHTPLGLRRKGENQLYSQLLHGSSELGWRLGGLIFRPVLEYGVPIGVEGERNAAALYQALDQQEVTAGILLAAEQGVDHGAGGIVHREQKGELGPVFAQPAVMTAVQLYQHAFPGHPLTAHPVLGRASSPWTAQSGVGQDTPQGSPAHVDALAFAKQLAQMSMVGPCVPGAGQVNHRDPGRLGNSVGRLAAPVTVSDGGSAFLPVSRRDAPGVAWAQSHQCSCLVQCHVLSQ